MAIPPVISNLLRVIGPELIRRIGSKKMPFLKKYFSQAIAYGYSAKQATDALSDALKGDIKKGYEARMSQGAMKGTLTPQEMSLHAGSEAAGTPAKIAKAAIPFAAGAFLPTSDAGEKEGGQEDGSAEKGEDRGNEKESPSPSPTGQPKATPEPTSPPQDQENLAAREASRVLLDMGAFEEFAEFDPELVEKSKLGLSLGLSPSQVTQRLRSTKKWLSRVFKAEKHFGQPFEGILGYLVSRERESPKRRDSRGSGLQDALSQLIKEMRG